MRNLKKFLALMLAMVMAMSLMITANATSTAESFDDASGVTPAFAEAVDVLSGMKVFSGDGSNFKPAANITRAEMAAVMYRLVSGDVDNSKANLYANYGNFKDVTADKWYAGYVGYCANNGLVKGRDDGTFDPTGNVTGYEALTMLLRAVGYDKNGEFSGPNWRVNVSTQAQQLGVLTDVNTTEYGGTLYAAARRDVIASLTFRTAAYVPTVTYSTALGYNQYVGLPVTGGVGNNNIAPTLNPTLGYKAFGLVSDTGIIVGNQDTGESVTRISFSRGTSPIANANNVFTIRDGEPVYAYGQVNSLGTATTTSIGTDGNGAPVYGPAINDIATFDAKTGLDLFAHKVQIWFDGRQTQVNNAEFGSATYIDWRASANSNNLHTYAYFDRASKTEVVKLTATTNPDSAGNVAGKAVTNTAVPGSIGQKAAAAGFVVNRAGAVANRAFERFLPRDDDQAAAAGTFRGDLFRVTDLANAGIYSSEPVNGVAANNKQAPDTGANTEFENLYLLISNSDNKALDVIIALNIQVSEITGVDNVNAIKTVTLPQVDTAPVFIDDTNELTNASTPNAATIEQGQLVSGSTTTLGQYEIGVHVNGTAPITTLPSGAIIADDDMAAGYRPSYPSAAATVLTENAWFKLVPVTNTNEGTVVSYNPDTGKINLQDGTTLDRSILYNSVVPGTIPQVGGDEQGRPATGGDYYQSGTYEFYLTPEGKYLGAKLVYDNTFIYGTYMDYSTVTSSSTFNYFLTGVNLNGEKVTVPVSRLGVDTGVTAVGGLINGTDQLGVPYRDTRGVTDNAQAVNGMGNGVYRGFSYNGTNTVNWTFNSLSQIGVISGDNGVGQTWSNAAKQAETWGPEDNATRPSVAFNNIDRDNGDNGADDADKDYINIGSRQMALGAVYAGDITLDGTNNEYLYFTENTKFILVEGFGEDNLKPVVYNGITELVTKDGHISARIKLDQDAPDWANRDNNNVQMSDMTYLTQSPFVYSQNRVLSRQADVIILPADAVEWGDSTTLRYVGDNTRTLVNVNANATQFTMYNNGVAESVWVSGMIDDGTSSAWKINENEHDHFYRLSDSGRTIGTTPIYNVTLVNEGWAQNKYTASTMNAQTGSFEATTGVDRTAGDIALMRVDKATITNLNVLSSNPTWPGINSLNTLNYAGSLGQYGSDQHGGNTDLYVSAITDSSTNVTQIYVCFDQTSPAGLAPRPNLPGRH